MSEKLMSLPIDDQRLQRITSMTGRFNLQEKRLPLCIVGGIYFMLTSCYSVSIN